MRLTENIEKFVKKRKPNVSAGADIDKRVLDDSFAAMEEAMREKPAEVQPNIRRIITNKTITKLAAAAVIIIAASLFLVQKEQPREIQTQKIAKIPKPPSELLTMGSLNLAYRYGGMEAVEKQSLKALGIVAVANSNIKQLQIEYFENNGI